MPATPEPRPGPAAAVQPRWLTLLARGLLTGTLALALLAILLPNTALAALRERQRWLSEAISRIEALSPSLDMVHVILFGSLGLLTAVAFPNQRGTRLLTLLTLLAGQTELIQCWVPGRNPSLSEVLLDTLAAALGISLGLGLRRLHRSAA